MSENYIAKTSAEFIRKLDRIKQDLENFSKDVESRRDTVFTKLHEFEDYSEKVGKSVLEQQNGSSQVEKILEQTLESIQREIAKWNQKIQSDRKGTEFMHKHEKYLVVMIFGAVKVGKSTLGNFFAGQMLKNAPFDNIYKHIEHPEFVTEDSGRNSGGIKKDANGDAWFCEGVTDTTGAIQYFTLSGLRWMDSPGTGALSKSGDLVNMEEMVKEYIPYTDFCVFLMNSSEPGLQADMKYISDLSRDGQEALVVITKSDCNEEDEDDNGNIVSCWCAKSPANRKSQEDDICKRIKQNYPSINQEKYRAISVSTLLAKQAVEKADEKLYRDSNLDLLMKILGDKVSENCIRLKEVKPKKKVNNFIRMILHGDDTCAGIDQLEKELKKIMIPIKGYQSTISKNVEAVSKIVCNKVKLSLQKEARKWAAEVDNSGKAMENAELCQKINEVVVPVLEEQLNAKISGIIDDFKEQKLDKMKLDLQVSNLEKHTQEIEHRYKEVHVRSREASGFWESVKSFFGAEYYETYTVDKVQTMTVDLGTNIDDWLDQVMPQIQASVDKRVKEELIGLQENYFKPQETYVSAMTEELNALKSALENLKYKL